MKHIARLSKYTKNGQAEVHDLGHIWYGGQNADFTVRGKFLCFWKWRKHVHTWSCQNELNFTFLASPGPTILSTSTSPIVFATVKVPCSVPILHAHVRSWVMYLTLWRPYFPLTLSAPACDPFLRAKKHRNTSHKPSSEFPFLSSLGLRTRMIILLLTPPSKTQIWTSYLQMFRH